MTRRIGLILITALLSAASHAVPLTPGNLLVSENRMIHEYTTTGAVVQSFTVPQVSDGDLRDIVFDRNGNIRAYDGTFDPVLSTVDPTTGSVTSQTHGGWSTVNNLTYGGISTVANNGDVFVTDMRTFGDGGADEALGVVVFDEFGSPASRFADTIGPIDLNMGLDGLLYALSPGGSPGGQQLDVYHPLTLQLQNTIDLGPATSRATNRAVAVDASGEIYIASLGGSIFHVSSTGTLIDLTNVLCPNRNGFSCRFFDIDIALDGSSLVLTADDEVILTDTAFASSTFFTVPPSSGGFTDAFATWIQAPTSAAQISGAPEPSTLLLLGLGLMGLGVRRRAA